MQLTTIQMQDMAKDIVTRKEIGLGDIEVASTLPVKPTPPIEGAILGTCFQPYVGPQSVLWNTYTLDQVIALLKPIASNFQAISTYGQGTFVWQGVPQIQQSNKYNVQAAKTVGLQISAGCALQGIQGDSFNVEWTKCEVDFALEQAKQYGNVMDIVIGDENIFGPNSVSQLITLMKYAKTKRDALGLTIPISTRQIWGVMAGVNNMDPAFANMRAVLLELVATFDQYIYLDMYAYFDVGIAAAIGGPDATQAKFTAAVQSNMSAQWGALIRAWTAQKLTLGIRFGETGWPTAGSQQGQPMAWLANVPFAHWYYLAMKSWMAQNSVVGYIFEAYDEPWKGDGSNSETHFGIWTASGTTSAPNQYTLTGVTQKYSLASTHKKKLS